MEQLHPEAERERIVLTMFLSSEFENARLKKAIGIDSLVEHDGFEYIALEPKDEKYTFYLVSTKKADADPHNTTPTNADLYPLFYVTEYLKIGDENILVSVIPRAKVGRVGHYGVYNHDLGRTWSENTNKVLNRREQAVFEKLVSECELVDQLPSWLSDSQ